MSAASAKWMAIAADIIAYEVSVNTPDDLLSSEADRWIERYPILARVGIIAVSAILTAHLANLHAQPSRTDIVSTEFFLWRRLRRI